MLFQSSVLCTSLGLLKMSRDTKREKQRGSGERKRKKNEGRNTHTLTHSSSFTVGRYGCLASLRCSNRIVDCRSYSKRSLLRRSVAVYRAGHNHKECLAVVRAFCRCQLKVQQGGRKTASGKTRRSVPATATRFVCLSFSFLCAGFLFSFDNTDGPV